MQCPNCHFDNPDQFKFCGACGTRIAPLIPQTSQPVIEKTLSSFMPGDLRTVDAERRHITVMFCDLVGSTELSEQLDPEDFRLILNVYQNTCVYAVHQYEGHVAQYLGDGVLIYFGYPEAHEDDSQRAIRCGLEILNELERLNALQKKYKHLNLEVRIGIHTGLVVVGDIGRDKSHGRLALGNTPNIAARLQTLADPNSVIISQATYRLVKNFFKCQALGSVSLKGVSHKMEVFKVLQEIAAPMNYQFQDADETTPFVGRENEVSKLVNIWQEVKKGSGKIALIIGEPGIGKTRLLRVFEDRIKDEPHTWLLAHCISYYKNSAFYPIINMINSRLKFDKNETNTEKLKKLEQALAIVDFDLSETVPIMASLLSIPLIKPYRNPALTPQKLKEMTIQILLDWLIKSADNKSYLFVIEDLHWADSSTLEHLALLVDRIDKSQILIILTYHPRFHPDIEGKSRTLDIYLHRLSRNQIEHMVREATGGKDLPDEVIDLVLTKTDGVPLFVEELTKMLIESEYLIEDDEKYLLKGSLPTKAIPDTLQDTLMARLDQLGAVKEVVQLAAIIGREFPYELLRIVISLDDEVLQRELANLVRADILDVQDGEQQNRYIFKQALIQDAAYNSVLKTTREEYHRKIARIIEKQFKDLVNSHPQIVAYHYTEAGHYERAIEYHLQAGRNLVQHSAHHDAIGQLKMGLKLLKHIDQEMKRNRMELDIQTCLGFPLLAVKGYGDKEVGRVYERARELCQTVGDVPQSFPALVGQYRFYLLRGDIARALEISEFLLSWAQTSSKSDLLLEANRAIGVTLFHIGEVSIGLQHLEEGIARYDRDDHADHKELYVTDPLVTCLSYAALAQCLLGFRKKSNRIRQTGNGACQKYPASFQQNLCFVPPCMASPVLRTHRTGR